MSLMQIVWMVIVGLIVGAIARFVLPGKDPMGWIATAILGIAGSFLGGFISSLIWKAPAGGFHMAGWIMSVVGALILLLIWRKMRP